MFEHFDRNAAIERCGVEFEAIVGPCPDEVTLVAKGEPILREGSSLGTESNLNYASDLGFEVGGPIIKDKLWFHVGANPSFSKTVVDRITSSQVDKDNDGKLTLAEAKAGMAYYVLERLEERYGNAPIVSWGVLQGAVSVPQQAHVGTGAAGLAFNAEGDVLGYVSMDFDEGDSGASGRQNPRMLLTSSARLASATQRAKSLLDSE